MDRDFNPEKLQEMVRARAWGVGDLHRALIRAGFDVTEPTIRSWMDGRRQPQPKHWRMLAEYFGVRPDHFFAESPQPEVRGA